MTDQDRLESLLGLVSPRPEPPDDVRERVLAAVEREWRRHKLRRWRVPAALAATVMLAVAGALLVVPPAGIPLQISHTDGVRAAGVFHGRGGAELSLPPGATLAAQGPTRLITDSGMEVRLDAGTRLAWIATDLVALRQGSVYVDTHERGRLRVRTPLGEVSDIGTRFMVTLRDDAMEVALRAGSASIDTEHGVYLARADQQRGDVVTVSRERVSSRAEPASAGRWHWIHGAHPGYSRREILPLLEDIADDLGLGLEFESAAVQAVALQGRLEGDISGLGPEQALEVVLATSGFAGERASADRLVIGFQSTVD